MAGGEEGKSERQLYPLNTVNEMLLNSACSSSISEQPRQGCFTSVKFSIPSPSKFPIILILHLTESHRNYLNLIYKVMNKKSKQTDYFYFYLESMFRNTSKTNTLANPYINCQSSEPCPTPASQQSHASKLRAKSKIIQAEMFSELKWTSSIPSIKH